MSAISDKYKTQKTDTKTTGTGTASNVTVPTRSDGTVGVRATLNNMGISNDLIGYDEGTKTVTLGGKSFLTPSYVDEDAGVSYASPNAIRQSLVSYYGGTSDPIVKVSDKYSSLAGDYGISADALSYSDGTVTIGGVPVDILYTDDSGKAWAFSSAVEDAANDYISSLGVKTPNALLGDYESEYLSPISELISTIANRGEFSYDPESDPVYQAYREQYLLEGNRATQNALASYSSMTGGYTNSAAVTAAAQAEQYYRAQLTSMIPELAQDAYERYMAEYETDLDLLENMLDVYNSAYGNASTANNQTLSNVNQTLSTNTDRDNAAYERYWDDLFNSQEYNWTDALNSQDYEWTDILNGQESVENSLNAESIRNENIKQQIYLMYYDDLLNNSVEAGELDNRLTQEKINQLILQNMLGY